MASDLTSGDPEVGLRAVVALHRLAEQFEAVYVQTAREHGWSWEQIGDALGVSRQSIHTKYSRRHDGETHARRPGGGTTLSEF
jgi:DNA-directed RNA polymerase specialized sigma24 family protein